jgi:hypothetical protein
MLKEIRAALRQCVDSNEPLASSVPPWDLHHMLCQTLAAQRDFLPKTTHKLVLVFIWLLSGNQESYQLVLEKNTTVMCNVLWCDSPSSWTSYIVASKD